MLSTWLKDTSVGEFRASHLGRAPLARPGGAAGSVGVFEWSTVDRILRRADGLDGLVVRGGRELDVSLPRDLEALRSLFERGLGLVIRGAERLDEGLAALAGAFARDLPGVVHLQLFVTAAGTNGFGWHYDTEEVFIVQTAGVKTYYFRENTVAPDPRPGPRQDFTRVREETSPPMACTLAAGDWLYLPRGWWHVAKAEEDSLSVSIGVSRQSSGPMAPPS